MSGENSVSTLDGLFKDVFKKGDIDRVLPDFLLFQQLIGWDKECEVGKQLQACVALALEHGVTSAAPEAGAYTLNPAIAGQISQSTVKPYQKVIRSAIGYDAAFQAPESGVKAFRGANQELVLSMNESVKRRNELDIIGYGRSGIGIVDSIDSATVTLTAASLAPGIWACLKGAHLAAFDGATGTDTMRQGANGTATDYYYVVSSVDMDAGTVTLDNAQNLQQNDVLYFRSDRTASAFKTMVGLEQIANTSGTLFDIVNTTYPEFKGVEYDVSSTDLSTTALLKAWGQAMHRGFAGKAEGFVSPATFANMMDEQMSLRRYDRGDSPKAYIVGANELQFNMPNGSLRLQAHCYVKASEGYIFVPKNLIRSGITDVTFDRKRMRISNVPDTFFRELSDNAGYELRAYSSQFIWTGKPGRTVIKLKGIVNS